MTKIKYILLINLVTPKAPAKHEPLFNEPASADIAMSHAFGQLIDWKVSLYNLCLDQMSVGPMVFDQETRNN